MARRRTPKEPQDDRSARLLQLRRTVQLWAFGIVVIFIALSFFVPQDIGRRIFPVPVIAIAAFTAVCGLVACETGFTGVRILDARPGFARGVGVVWMFAGCFLALFGLSYFFT